MRLFETGSPSVCYLIALILVSLYPLTLDRNQFARVLFEKQGLPAGRPVDMIRNIPGVFDQYLG